MQDRDGAALVLDKIRNRFPWLQLVWADAGYHAHQVDTAVAKITVLRLEIVKRSDDMKGFVVLPRKASRSCRRLGAFRPPGRIAWIAHHPDGQKPIQISEILGVSISRRQYIRYRSASEHFISKDLEAIHAQRSSGRQLRGFARAGRRSSWFGAARPAGRGR
jgi:hypothetical protein